MKIGIVGTGHMGGALGKLWAEKGHQVFFGSRKPEKAQELAAQHQQHQADQEPLVSVDFHYRAFP